MAGNSVQFRAPGVFNFQCTTPILTTANNNKWIHIAVVVNGVTKRVQWYVDGGEAGTLTYTGTARAVTSTTFYVGMRFTSTAYAKQAAYDDFRFYTKALTNVQVVAAMVFGENPSAGLFGTGCGTTVPKITANGVPKSPNTGFRLSLSGAKPSQLMALALGTQAHLGGAGPIALGVLGSGCKIEASFDILLFVSVTSNTGTNVFGLPIPPGLAGFHAYATYYHGPIGTGGATQTMDLNLQN